MWCSHGLLACFIAFQLPGALLGEARQMRQRRILGGRIPGAAEEPVPAAGDALAGRRAGSRAGSWAGSRAGSRAGLCCSPPACSRCGRTRRGSRSAGLCLLGWLWVDFRRLSCAAAGKASRLCLAPAGGARPYTATPAKMLMLLLLASSLPPLVAGSVKNCLFNLIRKGISCANRHYMPCLIYISFPFQIFLSTVTLFFWCKKQPVSDELSRFPPAPLPPSPSSTG